MRISDWSSDVCSSDLYLLTSNAMMRLVDTVDGIDPRQKEKLRFATKAFVDVMSPSNFALTNPLVLANIQETGGENLLRGLQNMLAVPSHGQLPHTNGNAYKVGVNTPTTPAKAHNEPP